MKKVFIANLLVIILAAPSLAQQVARIPDSVKNLAIPFVPINADHFFPQADYETDPLISLPLKAMNEEIVGQTQFDLQSNGAVQNRINLFSDGTLGCVFTFGQTPTSFPDRGSAYNYYNGTGWGSIPTARIESVRTGWPSYLEVGNGEMVIAHNGTTGLTISKRAVKGTGTWSTSTLTGPVTTGGTTALLWPRAISSGNTIHLIACTDQGVSPNVYYYQGLALALVYYRSLDGGSTWSAPVILPGMDSASIVSNVVRGFSGDAYSWAAPKGDTVAFVVSESFHDSFVMKSFDGGSTWTKITVFDFPQIMSFPTPLISTADRASSCAIDANGDVHVAFGAMRVSEDDGDLTNGYSYYPYTDGLIYWNENMTALDTASIGDSSHMIAHCLDYNFNGYLDLPTGSTDDIGMYYVSLTCMPQIIIDDNNEIFVTYSSLREDRVNYGSYPGAQVYRGLYAIKSTDMGVSWSNPKDLVSDPIHETHECVFGSLSYRSDSCLHLVYQADEEPGMSVRGDMDAATVNSIYYLRVPKNSIGICDTTPPAVTSPVTYYQNSPSSPLVAGGSNLLWYTSPVPGTGTSTAPTPSTSTVGSTTYYVTQTVDFCESHFAEIVVNVVPYCNADIPVTTDASRCGSGSVTLQASGGFMYLWYNASFGGSVVNIGPTFTTPNLSATTTYYVSNFDSCESMRTPVTAEIIILNANAGPDQSFNCGNSSTLAPVITYSGSNPLTYTWTPATSLSSTSIPSPAANPVLTTSYSLMVSDGQCSSYDEMTITVNPVSFNVDFSATPQLLNTPPFAVQFTNLTPNPSNYTFTWHFGDGATLQSSNSVVFHQYMQNGLYDVSLVATSNSSGCTDSEYKNGWIFCAGGTNCAHTASIQQISPINGCDGTPVILSCNAVSGATYHWNLNGTAIPNTNSTTYYAYTPGNYSVTIISGGCPVTSSYVTVNFNPVPNTPSINVSGSLTYCGGGSVTLTAPSGYGYLWSTGATTQSILVTQPGTYTVQISNGNGCSSQSDPVLIGQSPLSSPDICIVGVDSLTAKNIVIWNKPVSGAIDHFNVYGEGIQAGIFDYLGSVPYSSLSKFLDNSSTPAQQAYRYKISTVDTCGSETSLSAFHKTIHLTINQGMGGSFNLIWNYYEGLTFPSYNIYRGTNPAALSLLTTVASTLNSFTDLTPPGGNVYYQIEAVNPNPCVPSKTSNNYTRSNIATNDLITGIEGTIARGLQILIFPNPTTDKLTIKADLNVLQIEILDPSGRVVIRTDQNPLDCSFLSPGLYHLKVFTHSGIAHGCFIKQ